jgi:hypothetical protein
MIASVYTYSVVVVIPGRRAISTALALGADMAAIAMLSVARSILRGRPPMRPRARAAAMLFMV